MRLELEIMTMLSLAGLIAIWISSPLLPAIIIYRFAPGNNVAVSGPLAGLTVKASGAFAAYLIVFLVEMPLVNFARDVIRSWQMDYWTIRGSIKLVDANGKDAPKNHFRGAAMEMGTIPDTNTLGQDVVLKIVRLDGHLPKIRVHLGKFGDGYVDLHDLQKLKHSIDHFSHTIYLSDPIVIHQDETPREAQQTAGGTGTSGDRVYRPDERPRSLEVSSQ
jgi:hypothetical protein